MSVTVDELANTVDETSDCPACLSGNLNWLLAQAHYALGSEIGAALVPTGITARGHAVLMAATTGSHTQKGLAELVGLDKTTMVATLDELEEAGFALRVPSKIDRRAHVVEVTTAGRQKIAEADLIVKAVQADVLSALGPGGGEVLLGSLSRLVRRRLAEPTACNAVRRREPRPRGLA